MTYSIRNSGFIQVKLVPVVGTAALLLSFPFPFLSMLLFYPFAVIAQLDRALTS